MIKQYIKKCLLLLLLPAAMLCLLSAVAAAAGTVASDKANTLFVYADDATGQQVLLKAIPYASLDSMAHGVDPDNADSHYYHTYIDSYPCPVYKQGVGLTIPELLSYVLANTSVANAAALTYSGNDKLYFKSCDGAAANFTYNALLGVERYYYPDTYKYWDLENSEISDLDAVLASREETQVYLATRAAGGRILTATGNSGHPAIWDYIVANNDMLSGSLSDQLTADDALTLCFAQTTADISNNTSTYGNVKKWVYSMRLKTSATSPITSLGTVAAPQCSYTLDAGSLTVSMSCDDAEADIYYSTINGATQTPLNLYTAPIVVEDYDLGAPFTISLQAVREGYVSSQTLAFPSSQITDGEQAPTFLYRLSCNQSQPQVGTEFRVDLALCADQACPLYGCEYRLLVPSTLQVNGVSCDQANGWEYGLGAEAGATAVTFTYLDTDGADTLAADTPLAFASLRLTPLDGGTVTLGVDSALLTRADSVAYSNVTAAGLELSVSGSAVKLGDVDDDGAITMTDCLMVAQQVAQLRTLSATQRTAADTDRDGAITMTDCLMIAQDVAGLRSLQ